MRGSVGAPYDGGRKQIETVLERVALSAVAHTHAQEMRSGKRTVSPRSCALGAASGAFLRVEYDESVVTR